MNSFPQRFIYRLIPNYYRRTIGILLIYEIKNWQTFDDISLWINDIEDQANKNVVKLLIGIKCDLENEREATFQERKDFVDNNGMKFIETSAKKNLNVEEDF